MDNKTINLELVEPTDKPPTRSKRGVTEVTKELFEKTEGHSKHWSRHGGSFIGWG